MGLIGVQSTWQGLADVARSVLAESGHLLLRVRFRLLRIQVVLIEQLDPALACPVVAALERLVGALVVPWVQRVVTDDVERLGGQLDALVLRKHLGFAPRGW